MGGFCGEDQQRQTPGEREDVLGSVTAGDTGACSVLCVSANGDGVADSVGDVGDDGGRHGNRGKGASPT